MLVQAFIPEAAVEALDERVLDRLARLDEGERDAMLIGPLIHGFAAKLRPVVADNCAWIATFTSDPV